MNDLIAQLKRGSILQGCQGGQDCTEPEEK